MSSEQYLDRPVDIIVPFYNTPNLVSSLFKTLHSVSSELARLGGSVIFINDAPQDRGLRESLRTAVDRFATAAPAQLIENEHNLGFVRSANLGAKVAVDRSHDVVLLNSDTILSSGAISEMRRIAYLDPMIGFVSPRSNNASICSLPHQDKFKAMAPEKAHATFLHIARHLPDFHFVPTAVGFCLFIKLEILKEFGFFDESYGQGYNEENDLIMRANRCGFRAALANHAWVYHIGEASFSLSSFPKPQLEEKNAKLLNQRYPEYGPSVREYFRSTHYDAERLLAGLLPDERGRMDLLIDFSSVGPNYNGTFLACKEILARAAKLWPQFNLYVMVTDDARRFHELDQIEGVSFVSTNIERVFAVAFRFGQPFQFEQLFRLSRLAVINVFGMLDPIALDCLYLNRSNLEEVWGAVFSRADGVVYISDFVADLFRRRFRLRPGLRELVTYLSLDSRDYKNGLSPARGEEEHILVIGNAFEHKRVPATLDALSNAFPKDRIVAIGAREENRQNVISHISGSLSREQMHSLLCGARFVVFPSLYEGFGIPIMESLAYQKPVLARSIPPIRAIREMIGDEENLILYASTSELIERLTQGFPSWRPPKKFLSGIPAENWDAVTKRIGDFLDEAVRAVDFEKILLPRLDHMRLLGQPYDAAADLPAGGDRQPEPYRQRLNELATSVRDHERQIREIHESWSWRLTAPMRRLGSAYLRMRRK